MVLSEPVSKSSVQTIYQARLSEPFQSSEIRVNIRCESFCFHTGLNIHIVGVSVSWSYLLRSVQYVPSLELVGSRHLF